MSKLFNLWDEYQEFKGIKIYPFLMRDYELFEELISILLFEKNIIGNVELIKMSYLKYLLNIIPHMIDENGKRAYINIYDKFENLLKYILKDQPFGMNMDEKEKLYLHVQINDDKVVSLSEHNFDKIKDIILIQNAIPIMDNKLHPDLQKELQENMKFLAKKQGYQDGDIEDQIVSYKCEMKFDSYDPIKNMTIYQFRKEMARLNLIKEFMIYKTAEMSGMVTFNKPIPHWTSHISDEPDYSRLMMSKQEFDKKMNEFAQEKIGGR